MNFFEFTPKNTYVYLLYHHFFYYIEACRNGQFPNKRVSKTELAKLNSVGDVETEVQLQEGFPQLAEGEVNPEMESTDPHNLETRLQEVEPKMDDESNNVTYKVNPEMESTNRENILETGDEGYGLQRTNSSVSESANSTISSEATIMNCGWTAVGVVFLGIYCSYF